MQIKVAHIITKLELGGAQRVALAMVSHLDRRRFHPILITGEPGLLDEEARSLPGVDFHQVPTLVRPIRPLADLRALYALTRLLRRLKPDIVHTHSSKAGIVGRLAARLAGVPIVVHTIHGYGFTPAQHPMLRRALIAVEWLIARITTQFIAVSQANRQQGISLGLFSADRCAIVRCGVDLLEFRHTRVDVEKKRRELNLVPNHPVVGMIAPLKPQKAPVDYVCLAALVRRVLPEAQFLLIGDGELRAEVEAAVREASLECSFHLLGWRHDIAEILKTLDVFVLTSRWEGLPRVYLEALSSGVPVVGTNVDGAAEAVLDGVNGYLVEPGNLNRMAKEVIGLLRDPERARRMGREGQTLAEEFDIHHMVRRQEEEYTNLLKELSADR